MKLTLKNGTNSLTLIKEDLTANDVLVAFSIFDGTDVKKESDSVKKDEPKPFDPIPEKDNYAATTRPRAITLLNSERNLREPIESIARIKRENVKVYVNCPHCLYEGDQYTWRGNRYTKCKECQTELFNRPAAETWGEVDDSGYEYHATTEYISPWEEKS